MKKFLCALVVLSVLLFGCGSKEDSKKDEPKKDNPSDHGDITPSKDDQPKSDSPKDNQPKSSGYKVIEVKNGGSLEVKVLYKGEVPPQTATNNDNACGHGDAVQIDDIVVGANGELKNAVAYLEILEGKRYGIRPKLLLDQKDCLFAPHILICKPKDHVILRNSDPTTHNTHVMAQKNESMNENIAPNGEMHYVPKYSEFIKVMCDIHSWMNAWIVVQAHPYYEVSNAEGVAVLADIPAGTYKLHVWHPKLGELKKEVVVKENEKTSLEVEMK